MSHYKKPKTKQATKSRKRIYLKTLVECLGNKSAACKKADISRACVSKWEKNDPNFYREIDEVLKERYEDDFQKSYLMAMKEVNAGNWKAVRFMLEFLAPFVGIQHKQEIELSTTSHTQVVLTSNEYGLFTPELLKDKRTIPASDKVKIENIEDSTGVSPDAKTS